MEKSLDLCSRSRFQLKKCSRGRRLPEDRISSLPDDVLLVIMSFLPFKEVVKACILSRRWLNLWVHSPVLHFHPPTRNAMVTKERERQHYVKWVNRFLRRHKGQYLKEFKIACDLDVDNQKDIDSWLVIALAKKVECLELNLWFTGSGSYGCDLDHNYVFPGPFLKFGGKRQFVQSDLNCLKSFSLRRVDVTGEDVNSVLLNCLFLERLELVGSSKLVNLVISDPTLVLKYLKIKFCLNLQVLSISNFNLVSLVIPTVGDLTLTGLPMLVELFIDGTQTPRSSHYSISQASSCFSYLEAFTLSVFDLKDATQLSKYDQLTKLKRLVINIVYYIDDDLTKLMSIVNACPRLEEFVFKVILWPESELTRRTTCKAKRRGSSLESKSLKVFEYVGYPGHDTDVELIMHVVENAVSLEKIIIDPRDPFPIGRDTSRREEKARSNALQQFDSLRKSIPPHIDLLLR